MSIETISLVLHHSKATGTDKVILIGIANHDGDLGAYPGIPTLAKYANVSESSAREAVRRLEACPAPEGEICADAARRKDKACPHLGEIEVQIGAGPKVNGGRTNRYEVLVCCPPECDGSKRHKIRKPATPPTGPQGGVESVDNVETPHRPTGATPHRPTGATPHRPTGAEPSGEPSENHPPTPEVPGIPEAVARLWGGEGISEDEQAALWADLLGDPDTLVPGRRALQRAYYVPALARLRAEQQAERGRATSAALDHVRRFGEVCEHGQAGGAEPHPSTGLPLCPLCRAKAVR